MNPMKIAYRLPAMRLRNRVITLVVAPLLLTGAAVGGFALSSASATSTATNWKVGSYTTSGKTLSTASVATTPPSFNFTALPVTCSGLQTDPCSFQGGGTALLITTQGSDKSTLLGNDGNKTLNASFTISGLTGSFTFGGEPYCGTTAYVRYFFQTNHAGGFDETHYWWSNPVSVTLSAND